MSPWQWAFLVSAILSLWRWHWSVHWVGWVTRMWRRWPTDLPVWIRAACSWTSLTGMSSMWALWWRRTSTGVMNSVGKLWRIKIILKGYSQLFQIQTVIVTWQHLKASDRSVSRHRRNSSRRWHLYCSSTRRWKVVVGHWRVHYIWGVYTMLVETGREGAWGSVRGCHAPCDPWAPSLGVNKRRSLFVRSYQWASRRVIMTMWQRATWDISRVARMSAWVARADGRAYWMSGVGRVKGHPRAWTWHWTHSRGTWRGCHQAWTWTGGCSHNFDRLKVYTRDWSRNRADWTKTSNCSRFGMRWWWSTRVWRLSEKLCGWTFVIHWDSYSGW